MCPLQSTQALADAISLVLTRAERDQMEALSRVCTLYGRHVRGALTVRVDVDELRCRQRVATRTSPNNWLVRAIADMHCTQHTTSLDLVTTSLQQSLVGQIEDALSGVGQHFAEILSVAVSHTEYGLYANTTHVFSIGNHTRATVNGR